MGWIDLGGTRAAKFDGIGSRVGVVRIITPRSTVRQRLPTDRGRGNRGAKVYSDRFQPIGIALETVFVYRKAYPKMDSFSDLTLEQREAVTHVEGPLLVLAGAGSGKTRVITRRVAHLIERGVSGSNILALTFTNKAAGELRERIESLRPNSGVWVGTFHGICAQLLRTYAPLVGLDRGFSIHDQADRLRVIKDVMEDLKIVDPEIAPERVERLDQSCQERPSRPTGIGASASSTRSPPPPPRSCPRIKIVCAGSPPSISTTFSSTWSPSSRNTPTFEPNWIRDLIIFL